MADDSPQQLVARAREMIQSRGGAMNAENLNRAMLMLRGGPDEGFINGMVDSAAEGRPRPRPQARRNAPTPASTSPVQAPTSDTRTDTTPPDRTAQEPAQEQPVQAATRGPRFTASMSGGMDPLLGIAITGDTGSAVGGRAVADQPPMPTRGTVTAPATTTRGGAAATQIEPNRSDPTQSDAPGTPTGPAAARLSSTGQAIRRMAGIDPNTDEVTGLPRSMVDAIIGASPGLRVVGGAPGVLPTGSVRPPGPGAPAIEQNYQGPVERMNVPARMWENPPQPGMLPPPGVATSVQGPPPAVALPGARTPTMLEPPPPGPAQVSGPPRRPQLQTDRGNPGRTQDTASQRSKAIQQELRSRNRAGA